MNSSRPFFDTSVLPYALAQNDPRSDVAIGLLAGGGVVGVQSLNEFAAVARRKLSMPWEEIVEALEAIKELCPNPVPLTKEEHEPAVGISRRYGYEIYDSLMIAAALRARCRTLYSEDLASGQEVQGLAIRNPFTGSKRH